jgi:hypothetical protein
MRRNSSNQNRLRTVLRKANFVRKIAKGGGAVIRRGLKKVAVYRDTHGVFHETIKNANILCTFYDLPINRLIEAVKEDEL